MCQKNIIFVANLDLVQDGSRMICQNQIPSCNQSSPSECGTTTWRCRVAVANQAGAWCGAETWRSEVGGLFTGNHRGQAAIRRHGNRIVSHTCHK